MRLPLRGRLALLLVPLLVLLAALGSTGVILLHHLGGRIDAILRENYTSIMAMERLNEALERKDSSFQFAIAGKEDAARSAYEENRKLYRQNLRVEQLNITLPGERELVERLTGLTDRYEQQGDAFYHLPAGAAQRAGAYFDRAGLLESFREIKAVSERIARLNEANMEAASKQAQRAAAGSVVGFGIALILVLLLAILFAMGTTHAMFTAIKEVTRSVIAISAGNLDQRLPPGPRDELGQLTAAFNQMVEHLRSFEEQLQLRARLAAVEAELAERLLGAEPTGTLLDAAATRVAQTLHVEYSKVFELLPGAEAFILRAGVGWKEGRVGHTIVGSGPESQAGYTLRSDEPVVLEDLRTEKRFTGSAINIEHGVVSGISAKIQTSEGPYGVLGVHTSRHRSFAKEEVRFLQTVANLLGLAIQRRRIEEELVAINRAHRALSRCNQALIRATDESAWLRQICQLIIEEAGYRMCWVGTAESNAEKTVRPVAQAGFDDGYLSQAHITWTDTDRGRGPTGTCIRTTQVQVARNFGTEPALAPWRADAMKRGFASSIAIPLVVDGTVFGALTIYAAKPYAFGTQEQELLTELASDLAYGISTLRARVRHAMAEAEIRTLNAELEQRVTVRTAALQAATAELRQSRELEINIGFQIQQMLLLAEPPRDISGLQIVAHTIAAQRIAGDFYEFFTHDNQCLDVVVADVMGKGINAALLGAATKSYFLDALSHLLEQCQPGELPEPKEIVTLAHAKMARQLISLDSFVTLCYARLDFHRRCLVLVDCGHTGVLCQQAKTGLCQVVHGDNLPLGIREGELFDQISIPIEPGDLLLFYSDGVTEARNPTGELFGTERLLACVRSHSELAPEAVVEAIRQAVVAFSGTEQQRDDLTCVAIRILAQQFPLARAALDLRSDLRELHRVREFVGSFCARLPSPALDEKSLAELALAITEATSNIMKHAYHGRADQSVHLEAEAFPDRIAIRLHHLGKSFDPTAVPLPAFDGSQESGFGVYLISQTIDQVRYYRDERGRNCVAMVKNRKG